MGGSSIREVLVENMRRLAKRVSVSILTVVIAVGAIVAYKGLGCAGAPQGWKSVSSPPQPGDLMEGAWEGAWSSDTKPMRGKLTAVIEKLSDTDYRASFDAQTVLGMSHKSVCVFHIGERAGAWKFQGKEDLGLLQGGTYEYKGTVDGNDFVCTYDSTFDKGVFRMQRRKASPSTGPASAGAGH